MIVGSAAALEAAAAAADAGGLESDAVEVCVFCGTSNCCCWPTDAVEGPGAPAPACEVFEVAALIVLSFSISVSDAADGGVAAPVPEPAAPALEPVASANEPEERNAAWCSANDMDEAEVTLGSSLSKGNSDPNGLIESSVAVG